MTFHYLSSCVADYWSMPFLISFMILPFSGLFLDCFRKDPVLLKNTVSGQEAGIALPLHITNFQTHKFNLMMSMCWSGSLCPGQSSDNGSIHQEASWAPGLDYGVRVTLLPSCPPLSSFSPVVGTIYDCSGLIVASCQTPSQPCSRSPPSTGQGEKIRWRKAHGSR